MNRHDASAGAGLADETVLAARILWDELRDVWGHVSARLPDGGFCLAMVRLPRDAQSHRALVFSDDGEERSGGAAPLELPIHTELYRRRRDVSAVVHAHPHAAVALSTTGDTVRAISQQSVIFGDGIPVGDGAFVDTVAAGQRLAAAMGTAVAELLRGHGAVTVGGSIGEAVSTMLYLEQTAQQQLWAAANGGAAALLSVLRDHRVHRDGGMRSVLWDQLVHVRSQPQ